MTVSFPITSKIGLKIMSLVRGYNHEKYWRQLLLGTGAKVLDNVSIGNNVRVGLNAVVIEDIPHDATVILQRPRIITKK